MHGRIMAVVAAVALLLVLGLAGRGTPSAAAVRSGAHRLTVTDLSNGKLCDPTNDPNLCWANDGHAGNVVTTEPKRSPSQDQAIAVLSTTACGDGHVHSSGSCPFPDGSGLNGEYNGYPIVNIYNYYSGLIYDDNSTDTVVIARSIFQGDYLSGSEWVQVGCINPTPTCKSASFISVKATVDNYTGIPAHAWWAFTAASGQPLQVYLVPSPYINPPSP